MIFTLDRAATVTGFNLVLRGSIIYLHGRETRQLLWFRFSVIVPSCRSQWRRRLRRQSAAARSLRCRVPITLSAWMCRVLGFVVFYVGSGLCDELIIRLEESYRMCVCV